MFFARKRDTPPRAELPRGRHVAVTWDIPDNFGGLTKALLQRSSLLAEHAKIPVEILTFALQPALDEVREDLRQRNLLVEGTSLANMWEELREWTDQRLRDADYDPALVSPAIVVSGASSTLDFRGGLIARVFDEGDASTVVEVLRADGSLLARQQWIRLGQRAPLTPLGDWATATEVWSSDGSFLGGWEGSWGLWDFWFTSRLAGEHTYAIADSAYVGDFIAHYSHPACTTMLVVHNNHLTPGRETPFAPLGRWRRYACEQAAAFDGFVFLTSQQLKDFTFLRGSLDNGHVIPNAKQPAAVKKGVARDRMRGIAMANLERRKRLDHAVRAIGQAATASPGISLHLYGAGSRRESLAQLIDKLSAPAIIEGYTDDPEREYARASFMLLSSTNEGLPLVLAEAMAHGCVPIAYDIPYGPSDVITDGEDGFLVPAGDHKALGRAVATFVGLEPRSARAMRKAAQKRAKDFDAPPIIARWNVALRQAHDRRLARTETVTSRAEWYGREHEAMVHRLVEPLAGIELVDAIWSGDETLTMTLRCSISGGVEGQAPHGPHVRLDVIDRRTGERTDIQVEMLTGMHRAHDPDRTTYVRARVDVAALGADLDHIFEATLTSDDLSASDTIMLRRRVEATLPLPSAGLHRPILEFKADRGIALVTATPKVAATGHVDGQTVTVTPKPLVDGVIERVEAVGLGKEPTISATREADSYVLRFADHGRWKAQAIVGGRRRDVAWAAPSTELTSLSDSLAPVRLELTARGYLRVTHRPQRAALTDIRSDDQSLVLVVSSSGSGGFPVLIDAEGDTASAGRGVGAATHEILCDGLAAGTYQLRWDGALSGELPVEPAVQDDLPSTHVIGAKTYTLRRNGDRGVCRLTVTDVGG